MTFELSPLFVGGLPGGTEMMVILLIAVLLFGANKIPKLARSTGQAMGEFQRGREEIEEELEEMRSPDTSSGESSSSDGGSSESSSTDSSSTDSSSTDSTSDESTSGSSSNE